MNQTARRARTGTSSSWRPPARLTRADVERGQGWLPLGRRRALSLHLLLLDREGGEGIGGGHLHGQRTELAIEDGGAKSSTPAAPVAQKSALASSAREPPAPYSQPTWLRELGVAPPPLRWAVYVAHSDRRWPVSPQK